MRTRVILSIALNTYRESVRSKVLYSFFFFAVVMVIIASAFSTSTIGDNILILKDFGLFIVSIASIGFVVVSGSSLLAKELQKRTVFNMLAKPVYRSEFLLGKYLGMLATGSALIVLMSGGLFLMLWLLEGKSDLLIVQASLFLLLELAIVCAAAIFFSSVIITPMLTGMFTFAAFLAGRSIEYLASFALDSDMPGYLRVVAKGLYYVLPNLNELYVANRTVFGFSVSTEFMMTAFAYSASYVIVLLGLSVILFKNKSFV